MINWKLRLNPTTITGIVSDIVAFIVMFCASVGVELPFGASQLTAIVAFVVGYVLLMFNVIAVFVDPTTEGWDDSVDAMMYEVPRPTGMSATKTKTAEEVETLKAIRQANDPDKSFVMIDDSAIYLSDEAPARAKDSDIWIHDGAVYWFAEGDWQKTKSFGAIVKGEKPDARS